MKNDKLKIYMDENLIKKILTETESGYDLVADKFSETRKFFWRDLEFIKDYAKDGDRIFDFGCGNGRLLELFHGKNLEYFSVDLSQKLINLAKNKYPQANFSKINSGQTSLAYEDNYFNTIYSIAVFHHIPSERLRLEIAKELYRITQPGGQIIITVWDLWQKKYIKNILNNWLDKLSNRNKLDWNDCYISFKNNEGKVFQRYHHAFSKKELANLFQKAGFKIIKSQRIKGNIIIIGKK